VSPEHAERITRDEEGGLHDEAAGVRPRSPASPYDRVIDGMAALGAAMIVLMALWITYEVIARYAFNAPTIWVTDLSEYTMLYATFLAAPWLVREGGHVQVDILVSRLSTRHQHALRVITCLLAAAASAVLLWQGVEATWDTFSRNQHMARAWAIPRWTILVIIPLGSFFMVLEWLRAAVRAGRAGSSEDALAERAARESVV
jgi:TRAP-type C4-dicarboxylate transport system permease small subunit